MSIIFYIKEILALDIHEKKSKPEETHVCLLGSVLIGAKIQFSQASFSSIRVFSMPRLLLGHRRLIFCISIFY